MFAEQSTNILDVMCDMIDIRISSLFDMLNKAPITLNCNSVQLVMATVWACVLPELQIPIIVKTHKYEVDTLGDGHVWDKWVRAKSTANHL